MSTRTPLTIPRFFDLVVVDQSISLKNITDALVSNVARTRFGTTEDSWDECSVTLVSPTGSGSIACRFSREAQELQWRVPEVRHHLCLPEHIERRRPSSSVVVDVRWFRSKFGDHYRRCMCCSAVCSAMLLILLFIIINIHSSIILCYFLNCDVFVAALGLFAKRCQAVVWSICNAWMLFLYVELSLRRPSFSNRYCYVVNSRMWFSWISTNKRVIHVRDYNRQNLVFQWFVCGLYTVLVWWWPLISFKLSQIQLGTAELWEHCRLSCFWWKSTLSLSDCLLRFFPTNYLDTLAFPTCRRQVDCSALLGLRIGIRNVLSSIWTKR